MSKKSPWVRAKSSSHPGRYYYFNRETRASTWDPPPGFDGTVIPSLPRKERVNKNRGGEVADVRSSEQPLQDAWSQPAPTADENGSAGGKKNLQKANKEHGVGSVTTVSGRNRTTEKRTWVKQAAAKEAMDRATDMEEAMEVERWGEEEEVAMDIDVSQEDIAEMKLVRSSPSAPCQFHIESFGIPADYANDYSDKLYLVLDTNVLLSHLNFLEELKDYAIKGVGKPVLVIPWIVMQELDKHKSRGNDRLAGKARKAIRLLFSCFTSNHHRVRCQTMEETQTEVNNVSIANNDDRILHCCLLYQTKTQGHSGIVVLFSNDINLCSKALGNGVKAADRTVCKLTPYFLISCPPPLLLLFFLADPLQGAESSSPSPAPSPAPYSHKTSIQACTAHPEHTTSGKLRPWPRPGAVHMASPPLTPFTPYTPYTPVSALPLQQAGGMIPGSTGLRRSKEVSELTAEVESVMHEALSIPLKQEMMNAFDHLWSTMVAKKPPWSLKDQLFLIDKHWIAVYGQVLQQHVRGVSTQLLHTLRNRPGMQ
ncbi:Transcriptional protein SWT1 [Geodia barretti]|uniref:Transcriptional protein SWT1 n=1 Tax=Geodia barretti TaxID=519541 RepID=A0AA35WCV5_GEOBA|nr:Transcriptional protein SWT1 [Geodia barretti]